MSKIYISALAGNRIKAYIRSKGSSLVEILPCDNVPEGISAHPDIRMCNLGGEIFFGDSKKLGFVYPRDIRYNACSTGKFFIHNLKFTDSLLLNRAENLGQIMVNVSQGYTKCSTVVVDENSIITYDRGIAKAAKSAGMSVLEITPGNIVLPGYPTGLIGGTSGKIGSHIIFNGNLSLHPDFQAITDFITHRHLEVVFFKEYPLTDIGSIIEEL